MFIQGVSTALLPGKLRQQRMGTQYMAVKITKVINTSNVLKTIWNNKGISRIDIAKKLKLDKSTVTVIVNNLIDKNYVIEIVEGEAGPKGGGNRSN